MSVLIKIDTYFLFSLGIAQEKNDPIFGPKICESGYTHDKDEVHDCIINRYIIIKGTFLVSVRLFPCYFLISNFPARSYIFR